VCVCFALVLAARAEAQVTLSVGDELGAEWTNWVQDEPITVDDSDVVWESVGGSGCACAASGFWGRAEYLWWWAKGNRLPPLVTGVARGAPVPPLATAGTRGFPSTVDLFGGIIDDGDRPGMRFTLGTWFDDRQDTGLEVVYFSLLDDSDSGDFLASTTNFPAAVAAPNFVNGTPILALPFVNAGTGANDSVVISYPAGGDPGGLPDGVTGAVNIASSSYIHSVSTVLRRHLRSGPRGRIDLIGGYRFFRLREGLLIEQSTKNTAIPGVPVDAVISTYDRFLTRNTFHGGDLGFVITLEQDAWNVEMLAKVALGNMERKVTIDGAEQFAGFAPAPVPGFGGIFAQPTNMGTRRDNDFAALPEFGLNVAYAVTDRISVLGGYSLVMLPDVVRTGDQIDTTLNATQFPLGVPAVPPARPTRLVGNLDDFWVQGVNVGVEIEL
jgi:hypothetical protein